MFTSFFTGISGLNSNAANLNVVGNNLANVNTIGFKSDVMNFQDILSASWLGVNFGGNPIQIGLGSQVGGVSANFNQGSLKTTTQPTDMAVIGNGFFVIQDGQATKYTRAGNFTFDSQGRMVTQQGYRVQGWTAANGVVNSNAPVDDIFINPGMSVPPQATSSIHLDLNLDAETVDNDQFSSSVRVYDSLGAAHTLTYTFTKTANPREWTATITSDDGTVTTTPASPITMQFDDAGALTTPATDITISLAGLSSGAADMDMTWALNDTNGNPTISQFSAPSNVSGTSIDGYPQGSLTTFGVDSDGIIQGIFDNGVVSVLGQVAVATFKNPQGLIKNGQNSFSESLASGEAAIGVAGTGGRGSLAGNALELSNVDIAAEFTTLIISQRGYQASSRVITTSDEVLQEAIALKR